MRAERLLRLQYSDFQKTPFGGRFDVEQENPTLNLNTNLPKSKLKTEELSALSKTDFTVSHSYKKKE